MVEGTCRLHHHHQHQTSRPADLCCRPPLVQADQLRAPRETSLHVGEYELHHYSAYYRDPPGGCHHLQHRHATRAQYDPSRIHLAMLVVAVARIRPKVSRASSPGPEAPPVSRVVRTDEAVHSESTAAATSLGSRIAGTAGVVQWRCRALLLSPPSPKGRRCVDAGRGGYSKLQASLHQMQPYAPSRLSFHVEGDLRVSLMATSACLPLCLRHQAPVRPPPAATLCPLARQSTLDRALLHRATSLTFARPRCQAFGPALANRVR